MNKISPEELDRILQDHKVWLRSNGKKGKKADLSGADLSGAGLSEVNLLLANLFRANLSGANLMLSDLSQANLKEANLSGADLSGADLLLTVFSGADLSGADLSVADMSGADLSKASLSAALLPQADLSQADLSNSDLSGADLSGANMERAELTRANLSRARMRKTNLTQANLTGANLLLASITGAEFKEANLSSVMIDSTTMAQLPAAIENRFKNTFQIIELDKSDRFAVIREMRLPEPYYQAGLAILNFFGMFLTQQCLDNDVRFRIEYKNYTVRIVVETPSAVVKDQIDELFEVYGRIVQGKLVPDALSTDKKQIQRMENQFAHAESLLESEKVLWHESSQMKSAFEGGMHWLRTHVGRLLQHPESRPKSINHLPVTHVLRQFASFRDFIARLMKLNPDFRSELSLILQKFNQDLPEKQDIQDMNDSLKAIKDKHPELFEEISNAFYNAGMAGSKSPWNEALVEMFNRLA